jgi:hypothetical protein
MSEQFDEQGNLITTQWNSTDREAQYKALQAWFTKQAQELAALRNSWSNEWNTAEERAAYIKQTAQEEALKVKQSLVSEQQLDFLIDNNPSLRPYEKAIKEIANAKWVAFEDVIEEYGFWSLDKLQKAKERNLIWDRWLQETPQRSLNDLSSKEREERKVTNIKRDMLKDSWSI